LIVVVSGPHHEEMRMVAVVGRVITVIDFMVVLSVVTLYDDGGNDNMTNDIVI
jgi:hypothetical protein